MKKRILIITLMAILIFFSDRSFSDDKELFMGVDAGSTGVRPNVMVLMDSSGSMNAPVFYPQYGLDKEPGGGDDGFDPNHQYSGYLYYNVPEQTETRWHGRWVYGSYAYQNDLWADKVSWTAILEKDGEDKIRIGVDEIGYFYVGSWIINKGGTAVAKITSISGEWLTLSDRDGTFNLGDSGDDNCLRVWPWSSSYKLRVVKLYGTTDQATSEGVWWSYVPNYVKWIFLHATEAHIAAINHWSVYGTFDTTFTPPDMLPVDLANSAWKEWWGSDCYTPGNLDRIKRRFTRIEVAREVMCKVAWTYRHTAQLGLTKFDGSYGGDIIEHLNDMSDENSFVSYRNNCWDIGGSGNTPLAEALADVWKYYKPGSNKTYWPVDYEINVLGKNHSTSNPVGVIEYWCQKNYCILITDGESKMDRFDKVEDGYDDGRFTGTDGSIFTDKPVKRLAEHTSWDHGWGDTDSNESNDGIPSGYDTSGNYCPYWGCWSETTGSDYLDDVAYFMAHQDMFPDFHFTDDPETGWPGDQNINTYTIGFTIDNDLLQETAINGMGEYYTATSYDDLLEAFKSIITSILLRDFAFSAITAPKKTTNVASEEVNMSYVGYFLPSATKSIWEGHLQAKELNEFYGFDTDGSGVIELSEMHDTEAECQNANPDEECVRILSLSDANSWDAALKLEARTTDRAIYYYDTIEKAVKSFSGLDATNADKQLLFGAGTTEEQVNAIKTTISKKVFADVFHSDIAYVGAPLTGKKYLKNINPPESITDPTKTFEYYYNLKSGREPSVFVGTNDGVLHMIDGRPEYGGEEKWGFIPDEVLPSIKNIVINSKHTYTVDGRIHQNDIFYRPTTGTPEWRTILCFGLRSGGKSFYTLDVSDVTSTPQYMWKFNDSVYSGESWSKPVIKQIKTVDPNDSTKYEYRWVVFLTGGFAFNDENTADPRGKAIFIVDASSGELIWMIGYSSTGEEDSDLTNYIDTLSIAGDNTKHYTKLDEFNYSVPSAITVIDKDNNGFVDSIYFGNKGGHLFKVDISSTDMTKWRTYLLYKDVHPELTKSSGDITAIDLTDADSPVLRLGSKLDTDYIGYNIIGKDAAGTTYALGYIENIDNFDVTVKVTSDTPFVIGQTVTVKAFDPIFLNPAVSYDPCYQLWVSFGTGDRDRPRTNPMSGKFVALKDMGVYNLQLDTNLSDITDGATTSQRTEGDTVYNETKNNIQHSLLGFYYKFPSIGEKLFDPEPIVLPDEYLNPHVLLNTYQPPPTDTSPKLNPCNRLSEGSMILYDIALSNCKGSTLEVEITTTEGRIAGGGMYGGEYVAYIGEGNVASVPPLQKVSPKTLPYPGGVIFWKEKKR